MNLKWNPYYLLLLPAISIAMVFYFKINKKNFYHHYFKVIEEVETRNSVDLVLAPITTVVEVSSQKVSTFLQFLLLFSAFTIFSGLFVHANLNPEFYVLRQYVPYNQNWAKSLHPPRAP